MATASTLSIASIMSVFKGSREFIDCRPACVEGAASRRRGVVGSHSLPETARYVLRAEAGQWQRGLMMTIMMYDSLDQILSLGSERAQRTL